MANKNPETVANKQVKELSEWLGKGREHENDILVTRVTASEDVKPRRATATFEGVTFDGSTAYSLSDDDTAITRDRVASCREAYENEGIVGNVIDMMVDFACENIVISHGNRLIQNFLRQWARRVKLLNVSEQILKSYFRDGNVPILAFRGQIRDDEIRKFRKRVVASQRSDSRRRLFLNKEPKEKAIPYAYRVLDFLKFYKSGSELVGNILFEYQISAKDKTNVSTGILGNSDELNTDQLKELREALGPKIFDKLAKTGRLVLDSERVTLLHYKKDGWRRWATPMFWRIVDNLRFKKLLRDMDTSVAESVINSLSFVKLGNTAEGFPTSPGEIATMASLLRTPSKSKIIVWNDLVDVSSVTPPVSDILSKEKYEPVDGDIRSGIGVSEVLINGEGGNFANSFLSVKTLVERLEGGRKVLLDWIVQELQSVVEAMNFATPPHVQLQHMSLRDEEAEKRLLLELVDRNIISYRTVAERFGENIDVEIQRMKEEDRFRKKNEQRTPFVLHKLGKFGPNISQGVSPVFGLLDKETIDNNKPCTNS
jgi:hypothetical protein